MAALEPNQPDSPSSPSAMTSPVASGSGPAICYPTLPSFTIEPPTPVVSHQQQPEPPAQQLTEIGTGSDKRSIEFLLVSSTRKCFSIENALSIGQVKAELCDKWPQGEHPTSAPAFMKAH